MKKYLMFRSDGGGIMLQHPDNNDALADGNTLVEALKNMHKVESSMNLEHLQDQLKPDVLREAAA